MSSNIPPKPRSTTVQTFYTKGENESRIPSRFISHVAEPGQAARILQRNTQSVEKTDTKIKSKYIRTTGYTPGLYSGRFDSLEGKGLEEIKVYSLAETKLIKSKIFAEQSLKSSFQPAKTVKIEDFKEMNQTLPAAKVEENWLYMTRQKPVEKTAPNKASETSKVCPDWFNVKESPQVKNHNIEKSIGFDGTVTVLSRISGWMTVSPKSRNRQKRLGRYGPFDKSKKGVNFQNVSDLAPAWMQCEHPRNNSNEFVNTLSHPCQRTELKRVILTEKSQPAKSVFSLGDFRHNVLTSEDANKNAMGLTQQPIRLIQWPEDVNKQRFDKPVTGKIGQ